MTNLTAPTHRVASGPWSDLALHTIGWRAFQDLCSQVCEVVLNRPVEIFREAQDGGQDAVFLTKNEDSDYYPATIQVKHTSEAKKSLRLSDISVEIENIRDLVKASQSDTYIFMTNMSIDAPVALAIRKLLYSLGVRKPHILGQQYLVRVIRGSARLRAMVPQIYGLGDLTAILDERMTQQSRALLNDWIPKLKKYVPTRPHREAVKALNEFGVVLLLGNPSSGKSAIGAILATIASANSNNTVFLLTSPRDFESGWNPNDSNRFFWIDDAFGANVLREDYVQDWASTFRKLKAAAAHGNRFLLTSRKHIYEAAKQRLGQRNLPEFVSEAAVVDVGELSFTEKEQILYNHINFGAQTQSWKSTVKPYLPAVIDIDEFLPGIAERLGDPNFTKGLTPSGPSIVRFMKEPREHLIDTINALDETLRAALILVYVNRGQFRQNVSDDSTLSVVMELTGVTRARLLDALAEAKGSFLKVSGTFPDLIWSFSHPTIGDALTAILREKPHMMAVLLRGVPVTTILSEFICEGVGGLRDALPIPEALNDTLIGRLAEIPDERYLNRELFAFLGSRASDVVVRRTVTLNPSLLSRNAWVTQPVSTNSRLLMLARVNDLGLLGNDLRDEAESMLERAALIDGDLSFLDSDELLGLISPQRLVRLGSRLRTHVLPMIGHEISSILSEADLDNDPDSHFESVSDALDAIERLDLDDEGEALVEDARSMIRRAIENLTEQQQEREAEQDDDRRFWQSLLEKNGSVKRSSILSERSGESAQRESPPPNEATSRPRSTFSDVDKD